MCCPLLCWKFLGDPYQFVQLEVLFRNLLGMDVCGRRYLRRRLTLETLGWTLMAFQRRLALPCLPLLQSIGGGPSGAGVSKCEHQRRKRRTNRRGMGNGGKDIITCQKQSFQRSFRKYCHILLIISQHDKIT